MTNGRRWSCRRLSKEAARLTRNKKGGPKAALSHSWQVSNNETRQSGCVPHRANNFRTGILGGGSSTFDFSYQGDLLLGVIDGVIERQS